MTITKEMRNTFLNKHTKVIYHCIFPHFHPFIVTNEKALNETKLRIIESFIYMTRLVKAY